MLYISKCIALHYISSANYILHKNFFGVAVSNGFLNTLLQVVGMWVYRHLVSPY